MPFHAGEFGRVRQISIIGPGLLGGSIGLGLRAAGYEGRIVGIGRKAEKLERARQLGCIDEGTLVARPAVRNSQLVVLATPVSSFDEWFKNLLPECHDGVAITDVGSTKDEICKAASRQLLGYRTRFVGSHPMAGSELKGPENARADLFKDKSCIVTPLDADNDALALTEALWTKLGMRIVRMSPEEHDRAAARVSHLPHAVAAALVTLVEKRGGAEIASTGFRDTTRVASGDPTIWLDVFMSNRAALLDALEGFGEELERLRAALKSGDAKAIVEFLDAAKTSRDTWLQLSGVAQPEPQDRD